MRSGARSFRKVKYLRVVDPEPVPIAQKKSYSFPDWGGGTHEPHTL